MGSVANGGFGAEDIYFLLIVVAVAAGVTLAICAVFFHSFRREQNRLNKRLLNTVVANERDPDGLFLTGHDASLHGELVAQFKVNHGKQVVSLLESDGKRFIHVDGKLSAPERAKMVRYLKSEGFMS